MTMDQVPTYTLGEREAKVYLSTYGHITEIIEVNYELVRKFEDQKSVFFLHFPIPFPQT